MISIILAGMKVLALFNTAKPYQPPPKPAVAPSSEYGELSCGMKYKAVKKEIAKADSFWNCRDENGDFNRDFVASYGEYHLIFYRGYLIGEVHNLHYAGNCKFKREHFQNYCEE